MKHLKLHSTNFKYLLSSFKEWLKIRGRAKDKVNMMPVQLQEFFHFLEQKKICHVNKIRPQYARDFKLHLQYRMNHQLGYGALSNGTINNMLNALNNFEKYHNENAGSFVLDIYQDYLPVDTAERLILTEEEIKAMYDVTFESSTYNVGHIPMGQRDRAMIGVLYCGLRENECRNLSLSDIDFQNRRLLVRKGKCYKQRYVPIPSQSLEDIRTYIQDGRWWFTEHHHNRESKKYTYKKEVTRDDEEALFLNQYGKRMQTFDKQLIKLTKHVGINKVIGTHTLRHSVGSHLLNRGMSIEMIARMLGHKNLDSTMIYTHINENLKLKENEEN